MCGSSRRRSAPARGGAGRGGATPAEQGRPAATPWPRLADGTPRASWSASTESASFPLPGGLRCAHCAGQLLQRPDRIDPTGVVQPARPVERGLHLAPRRRDRGCGERGLGGGHGATQPGGSDSATTPDPRGEVGGPSLRSMKGSHGTRQPHHLVHDDLERSGGVHRGAVRHVLAGRVQPQHQRALLGCGAPLVGRASVEPLLQVARSTSSTSTSSKRSTKAWKLREPPQKKVTGWSRSATSVRTRSTSQTWCSCEAVSVGRPVAGSP